jgi:hypothetical protein
VEFADPLPAELPQDIVFTGAAAADRKTAEAPMPSSTI